MDNLNLKALAQVEIDRRKRGEERIAAYLKEIREETEKDIKTIEQNRLALMLLGDIDLPIHVSRWDDGCVVEIDLGTIRNSRKAQKELAEKLALITTALGCGFAEDAEARKRPSECAGKKLGKWSLHPKDFPGVEIIYRKRLPKGSPCKIVTRRSSYRSLVCDMAG